MMIDLKISSLQTNAVIALDMHKGLALQELSSLRRVEDSSAKPKLIAPGLLNLCVNDTMVFPPPTPANATGAARVYVQVWLCKQVWGLQRQEAPRPSWGAAVPLTRTQEPRSSHKPLK